MQVSLFLLSVEYDEAEGGYHGTFGVSTPDEARALGARIGRDIVIDLPDAQPPDVFLARVPEEEAEVNKPRGKKR